MSADQLYLLNNNRAREGLATLKWTASLPRSLARNGALEPVLVDGSIPDDALVIKPANARMVVQDEVAQHLKALDKSCSRIQLMELEAGPGGSIKDMRCITPS